MLWPPKHSYKEFDNKKKFLRLEKTPSPTPTPTPPPPITFLMVRPLDQRNKNTSKKGLNHPLLRTRVLCNAFPFLSTRDFISAPVGVDRRQIRP